MKEVHKWHNFLIVHIVQSSSTILSALKRLIELALAVKLSLLNC